MSNDYFDDQDDELDDILFYSVEAYKNACEQNCEDELSLSEDEFEFVIDYFTDFEDEAKLLNLTDLAFKKHPYSLTLFVRFCDTLIISGNIERALELLETYNSYFEHTSEIYVLYARAYVRKKKYIQAKEYFITAIEFYAQCDLFVDYASTLGQDCIDKHEYQEALFYLLKTLELLPESTELYNDIAYCYDKLDESSTALQYYDKYLDNNPFNDCVWFNKGTVHARVKDYDYAVEAFEYSLALNANNTLSLYNLGVVCLNLGKYSDALEHFTGCYKLDNGTASAAMGIADAHLGLKNLDKAKEYFNIAYTVDEDCIDAKVGYDCIIAIEKYMSGEKLEFLKLINGFSNKSNNWINMVSIILPQLINDRDFLTLLKNNIEE